MIVSASRRTDIPRFFSGWLFRRLAEGFALVRNPINPRQVSRVVISPDTVDCIALWTKDPAPMIADLGRLEPYPYYFQFTINPYGNDVERNLPSEDQRVDIFRRLADAIGPRRTVWRYSPILLSGRYTTQGHVEAFGRLASSLRGYTETCNLSFVDIYRKIRREMERNGIEEPSRQEKIEMSRVFAGIAAENGISLRACGNIDLAATGLAPARCIDGELVSRISGREIDPRKDPGQRPECRCVKSVDIGSYDTCLNGCVYCYANMSWERAIVKSSKFDENAPLLCDALQPEDRIVGRKPPGDTPGQRRLFP